VLLAVKAEVPEYQFPAFTKLSHLNEPQADRIENSGAAQKNNQQETPEKTVAFCYEICNNVHF
jgi:hypothetical protein